MLFSGIGWVPFDPLPRPNTPSRPVEPEFLPAPPETTTPPVSITPSAVSAAPGSTTPRSQAESVREDGLIDSGDLSGASFLHERVDYGRVIDFKVRLWARAWENFQRGRGTSWRGAFVGGELLVRAVTRGPEGERLPGNFPEYHLMP